LYKKRYAKGEPITSLDELMEQGFVFLGNTIQPCVANTFSVKLCE